MLKVLVPVDGSECSDRAVDLLAKMMGWYKEAPDIHLLGVHHHLPYGRLASALEHEQVQQYHQEEGLKALQSARAKLDAAGVRYTFHVGVGDPAEIIAQYAREQRCDQIVMGTHGRGRMTGLLLGSVATKVLHLVAVPVLLVK
jgi:nucleotide-binding universal stress UspA family protein